MKLELNCRIYFLYILAVATEMVVVMTVVDVGMEQDVGMIMVALHQVLVA